MKQLTYKQIYYITIFLVIMLAICVYTLSVRNTINAITEYTKQTIKIETIKDAPLKMNELNTKINQMEHLLIDTKDIDTEELLLEKVTNYCRENPVTLIEFPQTYVSEYEGYEILCNKLIIEGSFKDNLLFIYDLEQKNKMGMVSSVKFIKQKDIRSKKVKLFTHIYIQNIKIKKSKI